MIKTLDQLGKKRKNLSYFSSPKDLPTKNRFTFELFRDASTSKNNQI